MSIFYDKNSIDKIILVIFSYIEMIELYIA